MTQNYRTIAPKCFVEPETNAHLRHLKMLRRFAIKGDATPNEDDLARLAQGFFKGDPLADQLIADMHQWPEGEGMKLFDKALDYGLDTIDDAPASLVAFFESIERKPAWLIPHLLELGAHAFQRNTRIGISSLINVGLMGGYYFSSVIKPLMYTGELGYNADKRVAETARFTVDVSCPGNMQRFKPGFRAAVKVRMIHAMARASVSKADSWDEQQWGVPIHQTGMLGTNLLFSYSYIQTCKARGCRYTSLEEEAILHLWRYIGYLIGIEETTLPATMQEAAHATYAISSILPGADQDSRALAQALHKVPLENTISVYERLQATLLMHFNAGITRFFMGKEVADSLGLPGQLTQWLIPLLIPAKYITETLRLMTPGATQWSQKRGQKARTKYVQQMTEGRESPYTTAGQLKQQS
ncbi:MAG: hypothetical protein CSA49_06805 [Gammaproteobacteria bacterium]|nr:MAG: hypothetical protein CSA49_06805 [Gammaproteobacteria bacterium]